MGTQGGNNEFIGPGDKGIGKPGDQGDVEGLRAESQVRQVASTADVAASRAACESVCGPMKDWKTADEKFVADEKTKIAGMSPEEIEKALKANGEQTKAVEKHVKNLNKAVEVAVAQGAAYDVLMKATRGMA